MVNTHLKKTNQTKKLQISHTNTHTAQLLLGTLPKSSNPPKTPADNTRIYVATEEHTALVIPNTQSNFILS